VNVKPEAAQANMTSHKDANMSASDEVSMVPPTVVSHLTANIKKV
jgi:hypothetical protein